MPIESKYFTELARHLKEDGICIGDLDSGKHPIFMKGQEVGIVVSDGGMQVWKCGKFLRPAGASERYHRARAISTKELTALYRNSKCFLNDGLEHTPQPVAFFRFDRYHNGYLVVY